MYRARVDGPRMVRRSVWVGALAILGGLGVGSAGAQAIRVPVPQPIMSPEVLDHLNKQYKEVEDNMKKYGAPIPIHRPYPMPAAAPAQEAGPQGMRQGTNVTAMIGTGWLIATAALGAITLFSLGLGLYVRFAPRADVQTLAMSDPWVQAELARRKAAGIDSAPPSQDAAPPSAPTEP